MSAAYEVDEVIKRYHLALGEFVKGNPEPVKELFSHREDVSLANPRDPATRGREQVAATIERAASSRRDGEIVGFETVAKYVTPDLAYVVEVERYTARVDGSDDMIPVAVRATMILRPEDGAWKIVHRHADSIATAQPAEKAIQK